MITWTASNHSSFLTSSRSAKSILAAVRAGRAYVESELMGEGKLTIMRDGVPIRVDCKNIHTNFKWERNLDPQ